MGGAAKVCMVASVFLLIFCFLRLGRDIQRALEPAKKVAVGLLSTGPYSSTKRFKFDCASAILLVLEWVIHSRDAV